MKEFKFNIGDKVKTNNGEIGIIYKQLLTVTEDEEVYEYILKDSEGKIICYSKEENLQELHNHTLTITNNITGETMTFNIEEYAIDFIYEQFNCKQIGCKITCKY